MRVQSGISGGCRLIWRLNWCWRFQFQGGSLMWLTCWCWLSAGGLPYFYMGLSTELCRILLIWLLSKLRFKRMRWKTPSPFDFTSEVTSPAHYWSHRQSWFKEEGNCMRWDSLGTILESSHPKDVRNEGHLVLGSVIIVPASAEMPLFMCSPWHLTDTLVYAPLISSPLCPFLRHVYVPFTPHLSLSHSPGNLS